METFVSLLLIFIIIIIHGYISELHNDSLYDNLVEKLEDLKSDNNDKQKPTTVDVDFLVESYKQRLFKQCKTTGNYSIIDVCAAAFREGVENTLDELDLRTFINKSKEKQDMQKSTDIHPIFKVGDWVRVSTTKGDRVVQIASIEYFKDGHPSYFTTEGRWFGNGTKARLLTDKDVETITLPESKIITHKDKEKQDEQK